MVTTARTAAPARRPAPMAGIKAAAAGQAPEYEIFTGPPPAERVRSSKEQGAYRRALDLPVGGWFAWSDCTKKTGFAKLSQKWSAASGKNLVVYRSVGEKVIVKRLEDPKPEDERI